MTSSRFYRLLILALVCIASVGCDNTLQPTVEEEGLYSIYGVLNMNRDVNYIRIRDLSTTFTAKDTKTLDATVTLENLKTGATETLKDSVIKFDDVYTHNFKTTLDIRPATRYELTVERSDGATVRDTATAPPIADWKIDGDNRTCCWPIEITLNPVSGPNAVSLSVGAKPKAEEIRSSDEKVLWRRISALQQSDASSGEELRYRFRPRDLTKKISEVFVTPFEECCYGCCHRLADDTLRVQFTHTGPDFDEEAPPRNLQIAGSGGTFGILYTESFSFTIDTRKLSCPPDSLPEGVSESSCRACPTGGCGCSDPFFGCSCRCITGSISGPFSQSAGLRRPTCTSQWRPTSGIPILPQPLGLKR